MNPASHHTNLISQFSSEKNKIQLRQTQSLTSIGKYNVKKYDCDENDTPSKLSFKLKRKLFEPNLAGIEDAKEASSQVQQPETGARSLYVLSAYKVLMTMC